MKTSAKVICSFVFLFSAAVLFSSFRKSGNVEFAFPYKQAGLTERQAAAHLLSRFTYGAKPGEVDEVLKKGLEKWFRQQLKGEMDDPELDDELLSYKDIKLSNAEVEDKFPRQAKVLRMAVRDGAIDKDSVGKGNQKKYRKQLQDYRILHGYGQESDLLKQFISQKMLRAAYTNNQLHELLTDFWFNHFNVSLTKNQCAAYVPAFERDVIRPNVTGKFGALLMATAKSPAMLVYLDNFSSAGQPVVAVGTDERMNSAGRLKKKFQNKKGRGGLNENYAREVMELHTLGVDGGYTQNDVTQAARILTGWTVAPLGSEGRYGAAYRKIIDSAGQENLEKRGFVHDGDFLFVPARHDNQEKMVLGQKFPANGGYQEGVELLNMLAHHAATARFISRKLATRFVNDNPSKTLIDRMAQSFTSYDGDIAQVMMTMVSSPEFWSREALREKTKSPFELAISAVRGLNAKIAQPYQLFTWINKMGQKMYYYQAPTGFPDQGQYWINTGSLLNRMNFGLALASQRIPGLTIDLKSLNNNHEPESAEAALSAYGRMMMPERDLDETLKRLEPMLRDPELVNKLKKAVEREIGAKKTRTVSLDNSMLAQVVGVIIGSPEFQRK